MNRIQQPKIITKLIRITPTELYKFQIRNGFDNIRYTNRDMTYYPTQFGGVQGQRIVLSEPSIMEITEFEVT